MINIFFRRRAQKSAIRMTTRPIRESNFFNESFYLEQNPDVRASGMDAALHYLLHGGSEGRNPSPHFDTLFYLEQYPDVKASEMNPLLHYLTYGEAEHRLAMSPYICREAQLTTTASESPSWSVAWRLPEDKDLVLSGIKDEKGSIDHYIKHEIFENRLINKIEPDPKYKGSSVFICGTSDEIEILEDLEIRNSIQNKYLVIPINSSFHYFNKISTLFLNGRYFSISDSDFFGKDIGEVFCSSRIENVNLYRKKNFSVDVQLNQFCPSISLDLNKTLPHGPTTLLDVVIPFCVFNGVKNIYLFGINLFLDPKEYRRHKNDSLYIKERNISMNKELEMKFAHEKLKIWKDLFEKMEINCFSLSKNESIPFSKKNLKDIL